MNCLIINCVSDRSEIALYKGLKNLGVNLFLFCDPRETKKQELIDFGIESEELHIRHRFDLRAVRAIKEKINEQHFDLIYAPTSRGLTASILATLGRRVPIITYRGTMGNLSFFNPAALMAHLNPRVDSIVCVCNAVKDYLSSLGVSMGKLKVISKGHDISWYQTHSQPPSLGEFGIPDGSFVVGCVANIRPLKGIDVLLKAVAIAKNSCSKIHLLLIGEVRDQTLPRLAEELGIEDIVHFAGFRSDASKLIKACNITAMPSVRREGLPRAMVESMSQAIPVIVSDLGGMPEVVLDGKCGLVVPPGDPVALASAIAECATDLPKVEKLGLAARKRIEDDYSVEGYVNKFYSLFLEISGAAERSDTPPEFAIAVPKSNDRKNGYI